MVYRVQAVTPPAEGWEARQARRAAAGLPEIWALLDQVKDPEIPVISLWDLGILRDVRRENGRLIVTITPSYCGCPAMTEIEQAIIATLKAAGHEDVRVETVLQPAWSTDGMAPRAREALRDYGIAPPCMGCAATTPGAPEEAPRCPHCDSEITRAISEFGSTACKALWKCDDCHEVFDYFKPI